MTPNKLTKMYKNVGNVNDIKRHVASMEAREED